MKKGIIILTIMMSILCVGCSKFDKSNRLANKLVGYITPVTNLTSMRAVINDGANIDEAIDDEGDKESILNLAIYSGDKEAVKLLLKKDADVNYRLIDGSTNLFHAVYLKDRELIDLFIDKGADIHIKNEYGYNALDMALLVDDEEMLDDYKDAKEMIEYLEDKGLELSSNSIKALLQNSEKDDIECVSHLGMIKYVINELEIAKKDTGLDDITKNTYLGNNEFVQNKMTEEYIKGLSKEERNNLIYACAAFCNVKTIKILEKHVDITKDNSDGVNALYCALAYNTKDVAKYLLGKEYRLNATDEYQICAINAAIYSNNKEKIQLVLSNDKVKVTEEVLFLYPYIKDKKVSELFRGFLEDINDDSMSLDEIVDDCIIEDNKMAIDDIAKYVDAKYTKEIYIGCTNVNDMDIEMIYYAMDKLKLESAEDLFNSAVEYGNTELVERLVEDEKYIDVDEALVIAIKKGDIDMIELLVDEGADLEYESDDYSMLELAKESNYTRDVVEYIKENL